MNIYERVMKLGSERNIDKTTLEKACGFSQNSINKWKSSTPSIDKIIKVANYFGVTVDYLLGNPHKSHILEKMILPANKSVAVAPHFVAQLDFLKTKNDIKNNGDTLLKNLKEIVVLWSEYIEDYVNTINNPQLQDKINFRFFTDNIVMYLPYNTENYADSLMLICHCCSFFQYLALKQYDMILRGGLCSGEFYADESFLYGKAMVDSYLIEEKVAIYPRIVVTDFLIDEVIKRKKENFFLGFNNFIVQDPTTRTYYINFLWRHDRDDVHECRQKIKDKIKREEKEIEDKRGRFEYSVEDNRIAQKNNWLLYYINEYESNLTFKNELQPQPTPPSPYSNPTVALFVEQFHGLMEDQHFIDTAKIYRQLEVEIRSALYGELVRWLKNHNIDVDRILRL